MSEDWKPFYPTDEEIEILKTFSPITLESIERRWTLSDADRNELRVATNRGFKAQLKFLAWQARFLHYLTVEQQHRVQQIIDELRAMFDEDSDKSANALGQAMIESIKKLPPVH